MADLDIVQFAREQQIERLSESNNIKLLEKIKKLFNEPQQQIFITHFYCYLNYKHDAFVVDMDHVWEWLGFNQKYNAERMVENYFVENIDFKRTTPSVTEAKTGRGGHNLKKIMLTIRCFKSLCLKAQTKKASEIHDYYIKLEETLYEVIEEEGVELRNKLIEHKRLLDEQAQQLKLTPEQEKHKLLLREFGVIDGALVYIVKITTCEEGYVIKIGESRRGIKARWTEFRQRYGPQVIILDCFLVNKSAEFEKFLHSHRLIYPSKVTNLPGHERENELFLIGPNLTYATLMDIIEKNIRTYNYSVAEYDKLKLEYDKLKLEYDALRENPKEMKENEILKEILETNRLMVQRISEMERSHASLAERVNASQTKTMTKFGQPDSHIGPRLQKINPNNLQQIIKVYDTVTECMKEDHRLKRPSLNKAVRDNTVYCGYRWQLVDRDLDANVIHHIQPTKVTKIQHLGYIARLDKEKSHIQHVYLDRKSAASINGYQSSSALDHAVKTHTRKGEYYYQLFDVCEPLLKATFLAEHGPFLLYKQGVGKFDKEEQLIEEFICKDDCVKKVKISQKSLAKVLDKPITYEGFFFRSLGAKLSI